LSGRAVIDRIFPPCHHGLTRRLEFLSDRSPSFDLRFLTPRCVSRTSSMNSALRFGPRSTEFFAFEGERVKSIDLCFGASYRPRQVVKQKDQHIQLFGPKGRRHKFL
jgi:hypothetical protein